MTPTLSQLLEARAKIAEKRLDWGMYFGSATFKEFTILAHELLPQVAKEVETLKEQLLEEIYEKNNLLPKLPLRFAWCPECMDCGARISWNPSTEKPWHHECNKGPK